MTPAVIALVLVALVVAATIIGLVLRARTGRARTVTRSGAISPADLGDTAPFGEGATVVQFSTRFCSQCPGTRRMLTGLVEGWDDVAYLDVDLTDRLDIAERFSVLSTPTVLVLDADGIPRARFTGPPRREELLESVRSLAA